MLFTYLAPQSLLSSYTIVSHVHIAHRYVNNNYPLAWLAPSVWRESSREFVALLQCLCAHSLPDKQFIYKAGIYIYNCARQSTVFPPKSGHTAGTTGTDLHKAATCQSRLCSQMTQQSVISSKATKPVHFLSSVNQKRVRLDQHQRLSLSKASSWDL